MKKLDDDKVAEKVFQSRDSKGRVARDIIKEIKKLIKQNKKELSSEQYFSYQAVENIDGDYYLLREDENLTPLKEYLNSNEVGIKRIVTWMQTILDLFAEAEALNLNLPGIIPESLWVNENNELCIVDPIVTQRITQYREQLKFDFEEKVLLPPEIGEGADWSVQAQIYSIASFFYYLLSSKPLFEGEEDSGKLMAKIRKIKPLSPQIINPKLSTELSALLLDCLAKDAADRPESFAVVAKELNRLVQNKQLFSSSKEEEKIKEEQTKKKKMYKFKELSFWFVYRYGKFTAVLVVVLTILASFAFSGGYEPVINKKTPSKKVVKYFYKSINDKHINLFKETINSKQLSHIESMITNGYIIETTKNFFSSPPPPAKESNAQKKEEVQQQERRIFKIKDLNIQQIEAGPTPEYRSNYYFVFTKQEEKAKIEMSDRIILIKKKDKWKIKKIVGDIQNRQFLKKKEKKLKEKKEK
ncbi:hypothetical protein [Halanaerobacter jeridensis]|uniref:Serine/threonine protein kinase n=1 Tax=Halanaerobacter jeridensis TaxID=706427 RepID=A0A938XQF5_9FIRM|nr:hypothetical protein [Halanaerobacter jeridensis]MBM7555430.1 serine/threonine protein kinase [Halanaerobacter jeridensis]